MNGDAFWTAVVTSLIASLIFGLFFSFIPSRIRYFRIRPRVENDLSSITNQLLHFLDVPFMRSVRSPSCYQRDISAGRLTKADFDNALYGKCLSEMRCKGEFEHRLLPVGEALKTSADTIDIKIDRIQRYSEFLRTREILLLREVDELLHNLHFEDHDDVVNGVRLVTVNPTISSMSSAFWDLYNLYLELKSRCDSFWLLDRTEFNRFMIAEQSLESCRFFHYYIKRIWIKGKYAAVLDARRNSMRNNKVKTEKKLKKYLEAETEKLIYIRSIIDFVMIDDDYIKLVLDIRGEAETTDWLMCVRSEIEKKREDEQRNRENKEMIDELIQNVPLISDLDEKGKERIKKVFNGYL